MSSTAHTSPKDVSVDLQSEKEPLEDDQISDLNSPLQSRSPPENADETLDILWSMVTEEGAVAGIDSEADDMDAFTTARYIQDAATAAIEEHLTPEMEDELVNAMEQDLVKSIAPKLGPTIKSQLVQSMERTIPNEMEEMLSSMEDQTSGFVPENSEFDNQNENNEDVVMPLPVIIDFTPEDVIINLPNRKRTPKMVVSLDAPISNTAMPYSKENSSVTWHDLVAFVGLSDQPRASKSSQNSDSKSGSRSRSRGSASTRASGSSRPVYTVALTPFVQITPYSFRCEIPLDRIERYGVRTLVMLSVRMISGMDILGEGVCAAVAASLQGELDTGEGVNTREKSGEERLFPVLYQSFPGESSNICFLSQVSVDEFEIIQHKPLVSHVHFESQASVAKDYASSASKSSSDNAGFGATKMGAVSSASMASSMKDFPNPSNTVMSSAMDVSECKAGESLKPGMSDSSDSSMEGAPTAKRKKYYVPLAANMPYGQASMSREALGSSNATQWSAAKANDKFDTMGGLVDRHCKIRFVERMSSVMHDSESIVTNVDVSRNSDLTRKVDISRTSTDGKSTFMLPKFNELEAMSSDELGKYLDRLLVNFILSLAESSNDGDSGLQGELNFSDASGFTLLHYACLYDIEGILPILLSRGADLNKPSKRGKLSPLHLACGAGHIKIVKILVTHGVMTQVRDAYGKTPYDHAVQSGNTKVAELVRFKDNLRSKPEVSLHVTKEVDDEEEENSLHGNVQGELDDAGLIPTGAIEKSVFFEDSVGTKLLMATAFNHLTLKDKLAFNMLVRKQKSSHMGNKKSRASRDRAISMSTSSSSSLSGSLDHTIAHVEHVVDVQEKKKLDIALSLMNKEELAELEKDVGKSDIHNWLIQRNYELLQEASHSIQQKSEETITLDNKNDMNTKGAADVSPKHGKLSQALAAMAIRKGLIG